MNKRTTLIVAAIFVAIVGGYYLLPQQFRLDSSSTTPQSVSVPVSSTIRAPFEIASSEKSFGSLPSFTNTSTGEIVSFKEFSTGARNPGAYVYINGEKIDKGDYINVNGENIRRTVEIGGQGVSFPGFSPDSKFFAFQTRSQSGCCASDFSIFVIDITNKIILQISPPRRELDYRGPKEEPGQQITPVIESYVWNSDNSLNITFYFAGYFNDDQYYRISSKELWHYDLTTQSYAFLQTLPE